jgi:hypothetical protein
MLDTEMTTCCPGEMRFSGSLRGLISVYKGKKGSKTLCKLAISTDGNWCYTDSDFIVCVSGIFYNLINLHEKIIEEVEYGHRHQTVKCTCLTFNLEECTNEHFSKYNLKKEDFKLSRDLNGVCILNHIDLEQQDLPVDSLDDIYDIVKMIYDKGREYPRLQMELKNELTLFAKKVKIMDYLEKVIRDKTETTIKDAAETLGVTPFLVTDVSNKYVNNEWLDLRQSFTHRHYK